MSGNSTSEPTGILDEFETTYEVLKESIIERQTFLEESQGEQPAPDRSKLSKKQRKEYDARLARLEEAWACASVPEPTVENKFGSTPGHISGSAKPNAAMARVRVNVRSVARGSINSPASPVPVVSHTARCLH